MNKSIIKVMEENRESSITVKSLGAVPESAPLKINLKLDFGKAQCTERMNKIQAFGFTPPNNCITIVKEFETSDAAKKAEEKLAELKTQGALPPPLVEMLQPLKIEGTTAILGVKLPPPAAAGLSVLHGLADSMGDFASIHQYLEFTLADARSLKDILTDPAASPVASALQAVFMQLKLSMNKELPVKIANFFAELIPSENEKKQMKLVAQGFASFHHLKLEIELDEPAEEVKNAYKNEITMMLSGVAQSLLMMAEQFGVLQLAKQGSGLTKAYLCLSPILSFELTVNAPTTIEALEKMAPGQPS
jgi:hypothetical protein